MESREKVGHFGGLVEIGRERDDIILTSFPSQTAHVTCQKTGSGSKKSKPEVKCQNGDFIHENLPDRVFYMRERGPGPSVTAGVPCFLK